MGRLLIADARIGTGGAWPKDRPAHPRYFFVFYFVFFIIILHARCLGAPLVWSLVVRSRGLGKASLREDGASISFMVPFGDERDKAGAFFFSSYPFLSLWRDRGGEEEEADTRGTAARVRVADSFSGSGISGCVYVVVVFQSRYLGITGSLPPFQTDKESSSQIVK